MKVTFAFTFQDIIAQNKEIINDLIRMFDELCLQLVQKQDELSYTYQTTIPNLSDIQSLSCVQLEELLRSKGFKPEVCQVLKGM